MISLGMSESIGNFFIKYKLSLSISSIILVAFVKLNKTQLDKISELTSEYLNDCLKIVFRL